MWTVTATGTCRQTRRTRRHPPTFEVVQSYDEYVVAYTESRSITNLAGLSLGDNQPNALVHAVLLDSQVVGAWRRTTERGVITTRPTIAVRLTARLRRAINEAFERYAAFAGVPVVVDWSE